MDRKLVLNAQLAIAHGHRVEVSERVDELTGEAAVLSVIDLDTGIRYRRAEQPRGESIRWLGRVVDCTVTLGGNSSWTTLTVEADSDGAGVTGAQTALHGADAAVEAAKAEADRWGGGDRVPEPEPERFW
ncbi:hypothetical protein J7E68_17335 [Microbacterium sp. ISL-103]|jgi:hypothetical protein|uniref:hypothetical protein n=1 Tax=Microbacterium sp. ISL-103 TaxID=2819156 RepID=UPI001BE699B9|nr:hypothetical protein [Microbacterium sp. ISL-103]MBT2476285.1 hypothetical protein [Microbacterium sp. ISL-103]